jgi:hypothetical protein
MNAQIVTLAKVKLSWDSSGRIQHYIDTDFNFDQYQKDDILAYSAVVSFESQLGVMVVHRSLILCTRILNFIERNEKYNEPINSSLKGIEIELVKGNNIFHMFNPMMESFSNNDSLEDGVCQFLGNYIIYAYKNATSEGVPLRIKFWSMFAIKLFLDDVLCPLVSKGIVKNANRNYKEIQGKMIEDTISLYDTWNQYQGFHLQMEKTKNMFSETIPLCRTRLGEVAHALGLSY